MRTIYFDYYFDDSKQHLMLESRDFKDLQIEIESLKEAKDIANNAIINYCEDLYDNIASMDVEVSEKDEDIASDVMQGLYHIVIQRKKY